MKMFLMFVWMSVFVIIGGYMFWSVSRPEVHETTVRQVPRDEYELEKAKEKYVEGYMDEDELEERIEELEELETDEKVIVHEDAC